MAEPFKNNINAALLREMSRHFRRVWPAFPAERFVELGTQRLDALELKERVSHVRKALEATLPEDFDTAAGILERSLAPAPKGESLGDLRTGEAGLAGWPVWPMTDYVAVRGLAHRRRALEALRELTQRFSSEFAIRPFLDADPEGTLAVIKTWLQDPSPHVRRLASEGTRPRLPWGLRLQRFVKDPRPCLPLLEVLRKDSSEYVRRSVANHLNDISKDHPDLAVEIAERWLKDGTPETRKLVSHALRGLVKAGHAPTLALLGFDGGHGIELGGFKVSPKTVELGGELTFSFTLTNGGKRAANLVVDYAIHHVKASGSLSAKVFKGTKRKLAPGASVDQVIRHVLRVVTTRRYYAGRHEVDILVNGRVLAKGSFTLRMKAC